MQSDSAFNKSQQLVAQPISSSSGAKRVYVWGLNDKEQLGGPKGSKIKVPQAVDWMASLQPIYVAGGSKSLFIVTQSGKVTIYFSGINCSFTTNFCLFHNRLMLAEKEATDAWDWDIRKMLILHTRYLLCRNTLFEKWPYILVDVTLWL